MPFDAELVLLDGLVDLDTSHSDPVDAKDLYPLRPADGVSILDIKETGARGLVAVVIFTGLLVAGTAVTAAQIFDMRIQCSDSLAFTGASREDYPMTDGVTSGAFNSTNFPVVSMVRFATQKRYCRLYVGKDLGKPTNAGVCFVFLAAHPFGTL